jgi:hypothetical protein
MIDLSCQTIHSVLIRLTPNLLAKTNYVFLNTSHDDESMTELCLKEYTFKKIFSRYAPGSKFPNNLCKYESFVVNLTILRIVHFTTENYFLFSSFKFNFTGDLTTIWAS